MNDERNWGENRNDSGQQPPRYEHYQFHEESRPALNTSGPSEHKKNRNSFQKKAETTVALAVIFGLVAAVVFQAANFTADRFLNTGSSTAQIGTTQSVNQQEAVSDSGSTDEQTIADTASENGAVAAVAQASMPSVVAITTVSVQEIPSFFGYGSRQYKSAASGSGIIVGDNDDELLIATNNHVVEGATTLSVCFIGDDVTNAETETVNSGDNGDLNVEDAVSAKIKGTDADNDLAVVAVKKADIPEDTLSQIKIAQIGSSDDLVVGQHGDCSATYASMAESLRGGLSFTLSGFSFWSHDMGGFEMTAAPDVYKRWLQFGLLSTHSRLHGSKSYRVPWLFDEEAVDVCRKFTKLKLRLLPYLYSMAVKSHRTGIPSMRAMIMEFNDDPATKYLDMQYMLGDSILVAPIFNKEGHAEYYLPAGKWTHLLSGEVKDGGRWYEEDYDFFSLPVFVRENTLLPIGAVDTTVDYELEKDVQIQVYELNGTSSCEVVTRTGESAFTVNAVKEENKLTLETTKENPGMTYLLRNIHEVSAVEGGSVVKDTEEGIILAAEGSKTEVTF